MSFEFLTACVLALASAWVLLPYLPVADRRLIVVVADQTALVVPVVHRRLFQRRTPDSPDH